MEFNVKLPGKIRYYVISLLLSVYTTFAIWMDLSVNDYQKLIQENVIDSGWTHMIALLLASSDKISQNLLLVQVTAVLIFALFLVVINNKYTILEWVFSALYAVLFSVCMWFGSIYNVSLSWDEYLESSFVKFKDLIFISGYFLLSLGIALALSMAMKAVVKRNVPTKTKRKLWVIFLACCLVLIVCWLPYYYVYLPGVLHGDTPCQILQYYHYPTTLQGRFISNGTSIILSNDHPLILSLILGKCLDFGLASGNPNAGLTLYQSISTIAYVAAYAGLITMLYYQGVNHKVLKGTLLAIGVIPLFPCYALLIGGDSLLGLSIICFTTAIVGIVGTNGELLKLKLFDVYVILTIFFLAAAKNQGIYICIFMFLIVTLYVLMKNRRWWKQILFVFLVPILFYSIVYTGPIFDYMKVGKVGKQEALSVVFQQTARCLKYYGDDVTEKEKKVIDKVIDYDTIAENYDPDLSDPVKSTFRMDADSKDLHNYFKVWFEMGKKHPGEYLQSFVASTYGYYTPLTFRLERNQVYCRLFTVRQYYDKRERLLKGMIPESFMDKMEFTQTEDAKSQKKTLLFVNKYLMNVPFLAIFYNTGAITWFILTCFMLLVIKKDFQNIVAFFPALLVIGVCLLSPKNANFRYIYPAFVIMLPLAASVFQGKVNKSMPRDTKEGKEMSAKQIENHKVN